MTEEQKPVRKAFKNYMHEDNADFFDEDRSNCSVDRSKFVCNIKPGLKIFDKEGKQLGVTDDHSFIDNLGSDAYANDRLNFVNMSGKPIFIDATEIYYEIPPPKKKLLGWLGWFGGKQRNRTSYRKSKRSVMKKKRRSRRHHSRRVVKK